MKTTTRFSRAVLASATVVAVSLTPLQAQVNLDQGLEVHWAFDEGTGNVANDSSGNDREAVPAHNLFPGAVIDWSGGRFGGSVRFDRTYMLHSPFEYFGIGGSAPRTVSFWLKTTWQAANSSSLGALVGWGVNTAQQRIHVKLNGSTDADGNVLQHIRTENQGGNNFGDLYPVNDGVWHHIIAVFDPNVDSNDDGVLGAVGDFDHYVDGQLESKSGGLANPVDTVIDPDQGAVPLAIGGGYFPNIDAARTSEVRIDEFRLYSRALSADEIMALFNGQDMDGPPSVELTNEIEGAELWDAAVPIEFTVRPQGSATVSAGAVSLTLNGRNVTSDLNVTASGSGLTGSYSKLQANAVYQGKISATDSLDRTYAFDFSFDTLSTDNYTVEAEDFNFSGGSFFDDPVICNVPGGFVASCYFDRVSQSGVDASDTVLDDRLTDTTPDYETFIANAYRFSSGFFREEQVDTWGSGDTLRDKFVEAGAGIRDYDVERVAADEWLNYTRTFPAGTYQIVLRARARAAQTLDLGTVSNPTTANQTVSPLGQFQVPLTGGRYRFVFLSDAQGRPAVVELSGLQTLRLTALEANSDVDLNYLMFIPAEAVLEPTEVTLSATVSAGQVTVSWEGSGGVLQRSAAVTGPWENATTSGNSFSKAADQAAEFFRLVAP